MRHVRLISFLSKLALCFVFGLASTPAFTQLDTSSVLTPELVNPENINARIVEQTNPLVYSATRKWEHAESSPFTSYVISNEQILRNNFITLVDILKTLPGFVVSQPGSALEGETFMLRGTSGNANVKILINNVPLNPSVATGMPIGAQLPIRQAERIEVVYGPAVELYGAGACAAVINIILKETERPVFALADLGFGPNNYNNLDIMFGGKLGKDKNIFRFSLYGSSTVVGTRTIFYEEESNYNANQYLSFGQKTNVYLASRNFRGSTNFDSIPVVNNIPHESRLFGLNLHWRGIQLTYHRMGRKDHSALGLNPVAISLSNPSDLVNEQIENYALSFQRSKKKRTSNFLLSANSYSIDQRSTRSFVFDGLGSALGRLNTNLPMVQVQDSIRALYYFPQRYLTAASWDFRLDWQMRVRLSSKFDLGLGFINQIGLGVAHAAYYKEPYTGNTLTASIQKPTQPYAPDLEAIGESNVSLRLQYKSKKWRTFTALNGLLTPNFQTLSPRFGTYYQFKPFLGLFLNFGQGIKPVSRFYAANTFLLEPNSYDILPSNKQLYVNPIPAGSSEKFTNIEAGLRAKYGKFNLNGLAFYSKHTGFATNGQLYNWTPDTFSYVVQGYAIHPNAERVSKGIIGSLSIDSLFFQFDFFRNQFKFNWQNQVNLQVSMNRAALPYSASFGETPTITEQNFIANYPKLIFQWQSSLQIRKIELVLRYFRQTETKTNAYIYQDLYARQTEIEDNSAYATWDLAARLFLNKNLFVYFSGTNLLNRQYGGIDASGGPDDLQSNLQPGRIVRFGINYNLN